jgi:hypothetical protein
MPECCAISENLREEPSGKPDLVLRRCQVCQCRHFELTVDPGVIGVTGTAMGRKDA